MIMSTPMVAMVHTKKPIVRPIALLGGGGRGRRDKMRDGHGGSGARVRVGRDVAINEFVSIRRRGAARLKL